MVPISVGLLLLGSAGAKTLDSTTPSLIFPAQWLVGAIIGLELLVGGWLASALWSAWSRLAALGVFIGFAVFNWNQVRVGRVSCACFGSYPLSPWVALTIDLIVIGFLVAWRPPRLKLRSGLSIPILLLLTIPSCVSVIWASRISIQPEYPIEVTPILLPLGEVARGGFARGSFLLSNRSAISVSVAQINTSCACVRVILPDQMIPSGQEMKGELVVNLSQEPEFAGNLTLEVVGNMPDGRPAFRMRAEAKVK